MPTTKLPLPRFRVRQSQSRFYPYHIWDADYKEVTARGFVSRAEAQRQADYMNGHPEEHDALYPHPKDATE